METMDSLEGSWLIGYDSAAWDGGSSMGWSSVDWDPTQLRQDDTVQVLIEDGYMFVAVDDVVKCGRPIKMREALSETLHAKGSFFPVVDLCGTVTGVELIAPPYEYDVSDFDKVDNEEESVNRNGEVLGQKNEKHTIQTKKHGKVTISAELQTRIEELSSQAKRRFRRTDVEHHKFWHDAKKLENIEKIANDPNCLHTFFSDKHPRLCPVGDLAKADDGPPNFRFSHTFLTCSYTQQPGSLYGVLTSSWSVTI
jgi:hypothetical protein